MVTGEGQEFRQERLSVASGPPSMRDEKTAKTERFITAGPNIPTAQEVGPNPVLTSTVTWSTSQASKRTRTE